MICSKIRWWTLFLLLFGFSSPGKAECPKPDLTDNVVLTDVAYLKNDFPDGSDVTLECENGYDVDRGSHVIKCTAGTWSKQELICKKKDCGMPRTLPNMQYEVKSGTLFGAYIRPICDRGYYLQGSSHRQCLTTGWTGKPKCLLKKCPRPTEIDNGMIKPLNKEYPEFQDEIQYSCYENYILEGNSLLICQENGEYNSPPPQCKGKREAAGEQTESTPSNLRANNTANRLKDDSGKGEPASEPTESTPGILRANITLTTLGRESNLREQEPTESSHSNLTTISASPGSQGMVDEASFGQFLSKAEVIGIVSCILILVPCILFAFYRRLKRKGSYDTGEALRTEELLQKHSL